MASLPIDFVTGARARRWSLSALVRWLRAPVAPVAPVAPLSAERTIAALSAELAHVATAINETRARRRRYPAQRDRVFEQAAMAREMYRL